WDLGREEEAVTFARISRDLADVDDVYSQVLWRMVEAKSLARSGQADEGVAFAREALGMLDRSVDIELKADVLILAGRENEQGPHIGEALALYAEKGDVVLSAAAADRLTSLEGVTAG